MYFFKTFSAMNLKHPSVGLNGGCGNLYAVTTNYQEMFLYIIHIHTYMFCVYPSDKISTCAAHS